MTAASTTTSTITSSDERAIRQLLVERESAMRTKDADRLVADYAPDAVKFDLAPPLLAAGPELLDPSGLRRWFAGFDGPIGYQIGDLTVTVGGDVAFCHSLNRMFAPPESGRGFEMWFRSTLGLRKIDGRWRITHEHTSTPFYMDGSFKAAVDLKP